MPDTLHAADFLSVRLQYKNEQAPGELFAAIEHTFSQGTMVDHYFISPVPALLDDPAITDLGEVSGILFVQQPDGAPWQVHFQEITMVKDVCVDMPDAEFRQFLAASGVTLPGEE